MFSLSSSCLWKHVNKVNYKILNVLCLFLSNYHVLIDIQASNKTFSKPSYRSFQQDIDNEALASPYGLVLSQNKQLWFICLYSWNGILIQGIDSRINLSCSTSLERPAEVSLVSMFSRNEQLLDGTTIINAPNSPGITTLSKTILEE